MTWPPLFIKSQIRREQMTEMAGKTAMMEIFKQEGAEYIFGLPGTTEVRFLDELTSHPELKYILAMHEDMVVAMAEGFTRASGKVSVSNLHTTPGLAAAMPTMLNAKHGGIPMIITAGQQDAQRLLVEPPLSGDLVGMAAPYVKWGTEIKYAHDIATAFRRAYKVATTPPTGPVFISLPQDVLDQTADINYLLASENPVMTLSFGVDRGDAMAEVVKLAELIGVPVFHGWMTDVNFPTGHVQQLGDSRNVKPMFGSPDLVLSIGGGAGTPVPPGAKTIHIDDDEWQIGKNEPVGAGIWGSVKLSVSDLIGAITQKMTDDVRKKIASRIEVIKGKKAELAAALAKKMADEDGNEPIAFSKLCKEIDACRPANSTIFDDCWSYSRDLADSMDYNEPKSYARTRGGAIGAGIANAIGMALGNPARKVIAVVGDGSAMWGNQALWTAAHYDIPVTFVVSSNASYRILNRTKTIFLGLQVKDKKMPGFEFDEPRINFAKMAESMGVAAQTVTKPADLNGALKAAIDSNKPALVEVYVDPTA
jgi:benzoylformate decarboxylase